MRAFGDGLFFDGKAAEIGGWGSRKGWMFVCRLCFSVLETGSGEVEDEAVVGDEKALNIHDEWVSFVKSAQCFMGLKCSLHTYSVERSVWVNRDFNAKEVE